MEFPEKLTLSLTKVADLRYGENPHQKGCFYSTGDETPSLTQAKQLHGKQLSYNNIMDMDATLAILMAFPDEPCGVVVKHSNPCGVAIGASLKEAFLDAHRSDPLSAFGGIVGVNREVNREVAEAIRQAGFLECVIAPAYRDEALEILTKKKNVRLMALPEIASPVQSAATYRRVRGGFLAQNRDEGEREVQLKTATKKAVTEEEERSLLFAWKVCQYVKSNSIVLVKGRRTVGIGAGQPSRVDSVKIAVRKMREHGHDQAKQPLVLASDAFFPMPDNIEEAHKGGVSAIIQPGGSIRDHLVIEACDRLGLSMVFTGERHFRH